MKFWQFLRLFFSADARKKFRADELYRSMLRQAVLRPDANGVVGDPVIVASVGDGREVPESEFEGIGGYGLRAKAPGCPLCGLHGLHRADCPTNQRVFGGFSKR